MASHLEESDNPLKFKQTKSEEPSWNTEADTVLAETGRNLLVDQSRPPRIRTSDEHGTGKPHVAADSRRIRAVGRSKTKVPAKVVGRESFQTEGRALVPTLKSSRARLSGAMLALASCAATVGGCAHGFSADGTKMEAAIPPSPRTRTAQIPLPSPARLQRQQAPDCTFRGQASTPPTAEETRQKLDYEQQCYRQSEIIVRARLHQLQDSVYEMIKAVRLR
jgi:hypothetical protein